MLKIDRHFAMGFELIYHSIKRKKKCNLIKEHDLIDGHEYTIDQFYEKYKCYFDKPRDFYKDFKDVAKIQLHEGIHPKENKILKYPKKLCLFESPIKTDWAENNLVPFKWFIDEKKKSKVILLFAPGWGRSDQSIEEMMCHRIQQKGIDTGLLTVPYQQARTPIGAFSGEYFISGNMFWTISNFRHFVAEIRQLIQYMRNFYDYVGLIGMSSGGFQNALASNAEDVDFFFPFMTGCQLGSIVWDGLITKFVKKDVQMKGVDENGLNKVWSIADQLVMGKHCRAQYLKHYISIYDKVIIPKYQYKLWDMYGKPDKMEIPCSHYSSFFFLNEISDDMADYVKKCVKL